MKRRKRPPLTLYVAVVAVAAVLASALWAERATEWPALRDHLLTRAVGWCAAVALVATLSLTPLSRLARRARRVVRFQRPLGISAALLAILHALIALGGPLEDAWASVLSWPYLRAGLLALSILVALLITSFPRLTRALRVRLWKPLHRLSYAAGALVVLHLYLGPYAPRWATLTLALVLAVGLLARLLPRRRLRKPPSTPAIR